MPSSRPQIPLWRRLLMPFGHVYGSAMTIRRRLYAKGWIKSHRFGVPVVSVGNLTMGGTGKTPMVSAILDRLPEALKPAMVLARGYGRQFEVSGVLLNDEGHLLHRRHPDAIQVQGADRVAAVKIAPGAGQARVVILDDGAQHLKVRRDLEILLFDARALDEGPLVLPAGRWRENLAAAADADVLCVTRIDRVTPTDRARLKRRLSEVAPGVPIFFCSHRARELLSVDPDRPPEDMSVLAGRRVGLVSSIADPHSFRETVEAQGAEVAWQRAWPDHHVYTEQDIATMSAQTQVASDAIDGICTTEKDLAKMQRLAPLPFSLSALSIELDFAEDDQAFTEFLHSRLSELVRD